MIVIGKKIDELDGYVIHGFPRAGTGKHGNDYVKIEKKGERGKFKLDTGKWEEGHSLDAAIKKKLEEHILTNKESLRQKIKELD